MATITNEQEFNAWLEGKPRHAMEVIGARIALRTLPLIEGASKVGSVRLVQPIPLLLPTFRCLAAAVLGATSAKPSKVRRQAARRAAIMLDGLNVQSQPQLPVAFAAAAAARLLDSAAVRATVVSVAHAAVYAFAYEDKDALSYAKIAIEQVSQLAQAASSVAEVAIWESVQSDIEILEGGEKPKILAQKPIWDQIRWPDRMPNEFGRLWFNLKIDLLDLHEDWTVWTDWYDAILDGNLMEPTELSHFRVSLNDETDWEKGPAHVNALIKARIESRGEKGSTKPENSEGTATRNARSSQTPKAKSALSKTVIANAQSLTEQIDLLIEAIDLRREDLESHKPNDEEEYAAWKIEHDNILHLAGRVHAVEKSVRDFLACQGSEDAIEPTVVSLSNSLKVWWSKHDQELINHAWRFGRKAGKLGVVVASAGVGASFGMAFATTPVAIALMGGDKLIEQVNKLKLPTVKG